MTFDEIVSDYIREYRDEGRKEMRLPKPYGALLKARACFARFGDSRHCIR
jgi:hypothetical protein